MQQSQQVKEKLDKEISKAEGRLKEFELTEAYEKVRMLLGQKNYAKGEGCLPVLQFEMISNNKSSTRYWRREETKNMLEFFHRGSEPSLLRYGIILLPIQVMIS